MHTHMHMHMHACMHGYPIHSSTGHQPTSSGTLTAPTPWCAAVVTAAAEISIRKRAGRRGCVAALRGTLKAQLEQDQRSGPKHGIISSGSEKMRLRINWHGYGMARFWRNLSRRST